MLVCIEDGERVETWRGQWDFGRKAEKWLASHSATKVSSRPSIPESTDPFSDLSFFDSDREDNLNERTSFGPLVLRTGADRHSISPTS